MYTFENELSVVVCDLAIGQVREAVSVAFGDAVQYLPVPCLVTRVDVMPTIDKEAFQAVMCAAIATAQEKTSTKCGCYDAIRTALLKKRT